jgi:nucleoside-diphosphate-sugar epimerase
MYLIKLLLGIVVGFVLIVVGLAFSLRATIPDNSFDLQPLVNNSKDLRPVLIFGATRNTGYEVAKILRGRGQLVTAVVRPTSNRELLEAIGADFVVADALDSGAVQKAVSSADYQAVISTMGCMRCEPPPDVVGHRNIINAMESASNKRIIFVSAIGAGDSYDALNLISKVVLRKLLPMKTEVEDLLNDSGLDFTVIRPGGLRFGDSQPTGEGVFSEDRSMMGFIHRADLARLIVSSLDDSRTIGKVFGAIDPTIQTPWE